MYEDNLTEERWIEVQFYYICSDIYDYSQDLLTTLDFIEALARIGKVDAQSVRAVANNTLCDHRQRPGKEEAALLCYKKGVSTRAICEQCRINNNKLYILVNQDKDDPIMFYPRAKQEHRTLMRAFIDVVEIFKKDVGIKWKKKN